MLYGKYFYCQWNTFMARKCFHGNENLSCLWNTFIARKHFPGNEMLYSIKCLQSKQRNTFMKSKCFHGKETLSSPWNAFIPMKRFQAMKRFHSNETLSWQWNAFMERKYNLIGYNSYPLFWIVLMKHRTYCITYNQGTGTVSKLDVTSS